MAELSEGQIAIVCSSPIYHYPYRHPIPDLGLTHNTSTVQREDQRLRHRQRAGAVRRRRERSQVDSTPRAKATDKRLEHRPPLVGGHGKTRRTGASVRETRRETDTAERSNADENPRCA